MLNTEFAAGVVYVFCAFCRASFGTRRTEWDAIQGAVDHGTREIVLSVGEPDAGNAITLNICRQCLRAGLEIRIPDELRQESPNSKTEGNSK